MSAITEAEVLINGPRRQSYGPAKESFVRVGQVWSAILGTPVSSEQVALCMAGFKLIREAYSHKHDNIVDAIGYLGLLEQVVGEERPNPPTS